MTRYEIENELDKLYRDLEVAHNTDEQTICRAFNADSKQEYIKILVGEIDNYESALEEYDIPDDEGMDYEALCRIQGIARYA